MIQNEGDGELGDGDTDLGHARRALGALVAEDKDHTLLDLARLERGVEGRQPDCGTEW